MDSGDGKRLYSCQEDGQVTSVPTLRSCEKDLHMNGSEKADCIGTTPSNTRNKRKNAKRKATSMRPSRRSDEEDATLSPETCIQDVDQKKVLDSETSLELDPSMPSLQGKANLEQFEDSKQYSVSEEGHDVKHPTSRKRGRPRKLPMTVDKTPAKNDVVEPKGPIVIGLTSNGKFLNSRVRNLLKKTMANDNEAASESPKEGEVTNLKRKRGRPPKVIFQLASPKTENTDTTGTPCLRMSGLGDAHAPETVEKTRSDVPVVKDSVERPLACEAENPVDAIEPLSTSNSTPSSDPHTTPMSVISDQFKRSRDIRRLSFGKRSIGKRLARKHNKVSIAALDPANAFILRGKKLKSNSAAKLPTKDATDISIEKPVEEPQNGVDREVTVVAAASSNASEDDRTLSAWLKRAHSPSETDTCQVVETPAGNSSHDNDATKKPDETIIQCTAIVPRKTQVLPFRKNSLVWGVIESMDVLKRIPQNPHFFPLYNCKEECREGLAIGSMVTFTGLAEKVSRARFDDPKSDLDGYLETLVDLEKLGFNVGPVRELLHKLLSIKTKYEQAENTCIEMESRIKERTEENSKMDFEIAELEKKMKELEERHALAMSRKESNDSEITLLQFSMDTVKTSLDAAQHEFDEVTASLRVTDKSITRVPLQLTRGRRN